MGDDISFRVRERRGIRNVDWAIMDDGLVGSDNPQHELERQTRRLCEEAERILKNKNLTTAQDVAADKIKNIDPSERNNLNAIIFYAIIDWKKKIAADYGYLSLEYLSADFLGWYHLNFFCENIAEQPDEKRALILSLCNAWHWLHMEVYEEHRRAVQGETHLRTLASPGIARTHQANKRWDIIRWHCEPLLKRGMSAQQILNKARHTINSDLEARKFKSYKDGSLLRTIQKIARQQKSKKEIIA